MKVYLCHECRTEVTEQIFWDLFGAPYHAKCYIDALPPHPGPEVDPTLLKALLADHEYGNHPEPHGHFGCALCVEEDRIFPSQEVCK